MSNICLIPIDLTKGDERYHPDIHTDGRQYLVRIDGRFWAGNFHEQWFGLSFWGWNGRSYQYDQPGTNHSGWEAVWEIHIAPEGIGKTNA